MEVDWAYAVEASEKHHPDHPQMETLRDQGEGGCGWHPVIPEAQHSGQADEREH